MRKIIIVCVAVILLTCTACGQNRLYPVSGQVTYRGVPAAGATVFFFRRAAEPIDEQVIMGKVQEDGTFKLDCGTLGKGAPPGVYDVLVTWRPTACCPVKGRQCGLDQLKGRYADPKNPRLHATIKGEPNVLAPFALTDGP